MVARWARRRAAIGKLPWATGKTDDSEVCDTAAEWKKCAVRATIAAVRAGNAHMRARLERGTLDAASHSARRKNRFKGV
jgi:hypothetical protein